MKILCDTCSILMVIRIAPDMLTDEMYGCFTIQEVRKEIIRQQKFKDKYPWRRRFKDKIRCIPNSEILNNNAVNQYVEAINLLIESNIINNKTGRLFDLSPIDRKFASCAFESMVKTTFDPKISPVFSSICDNIKVLYWFDPPNGLNKSQVDANMG